MTNRLDDVDAMVVELTTAIDDKLAMDTRFRFEICLSEALTNLVKHAKTSDADAPIELHLTTENDTVIIDLFDPVGAQPFDLRTKAPDLDQVDLLAESGRGLGLIVQCADSVDYGPVNGKNRLSLTFTNAA
ncbi:ATP-binding protein [Monaibacterium marinum]|nr:ATP-binding protein [Monaibacterium marinum]